MNLNYNLEFTLKKTKKFKFCGQEKQNRKILMKHNITRHIVGDIVKLTVYYINKDKCVKCGPGFRGSKKIKHKHSCWLCSQRHLYYTEWFQCTFTFHRRNLLHTQQLSAHLVPIYSYTSEICCTRHEIRED